jgi:hypothetical protein
MILARFRKEPRLEREAHTDDQLERNHHWGNGE